MMQQAQECVAESKIKSVSDSFFKNRSLIENQKKRREDYWKTPLVTYTAGDNIAKTFSYNDLKF